ncbi:MAG TPA: hypothetical protein VF602_02995 [Pedobacter sp.]|jgi:hypothetical protein
MQIRFSRYNAPFTEPSDENVHYISLDDQLAMRAGRFDAHVTAYRSLPKTRVVEAYDSLTGTTHVFDLGNTFYIPPFARLPEPDIDHDDQKFLDDLFYKSGIKAAGKRVKRCF